MVDAREALQHLLVLAKHPNGAGHLSWWADELAAEVRAALPDEQVESVQCPECSGMGERYYRQADATMECLRCKGLGAVPEETL
jgi:hypothetical protein